MTKDQLGKEFSRFLFENLPAGYHFWPGLVVVRGMPEAFIASPPGVRVEISLEAWEKDLSAIFVMFSRPRQVEVQDDPMGLITKFVCEQVVTVVVSKFYYSTGMTWDVRERESDYEVASCVRPPLGRFRELERLLPAKGLFKAGVTGGAFVGPRGGKQAVLTREGWKKQ